ncbi:hypothetical protein DMENIID0001_007460 [Sergentomyia squamirostris]
MWVWGWFLVLLRPHIHLSCSLGGLQYVVVERGRRRRTEQINQIGEQHTPPFGGSVGDTLKWEKEWTQSPRKSSQILLRGWTMRVGGTLNCENFANEGELKKGEEGDGKFN